MLRAELCKKQHNTLIYTDITTDIKKELGDERDIIYNSIFDTNDNLSKLWRINVYQNSANNNEGA